MNKRFFAMLLAICMMVGLFACGKKNPPAQPSTETTAAPTTEPVVIEEIPSLVNNPEGGSNVFEDEDEPQAPAVQEKPTIARPETEPTETPTEEPEEPSVAPSEGKNEPPAAELTEYERFMNMSGAEQKAFMESFPSVEEFFAWLNQAKAEYEALHPDIEVDGGVVDLTKGNG